MNAKEGSTMRSGALGRGLDTLMGSERENAEQVEWDEMREAVEGGGLQGTDSDPDPRESSAEDRASAPRQERSLERSACLVGGLIASGAAGAIVIATFSLLGVKAVLSMARSPRW